MYWLVITIFGAVNCFSGYRLFKILLAVTGFLIGANISWTIALNVTDGSKIIAIISAILGGIIGALIVSLLYFVGIFFFGAFFAYFLGSMFLSMFADNSPLLFLIISSILGGIIALFLQKLIIIMATSIGGAWYIILGISKFFGISMMNAQTIINIHGLNLQNKNQIFIFLIWLILSISGIIIQFAKTSRKTGVYTAQPRPLLKKA